MAHEVMWTNRLVTDFIREACLSDDESKLITSRAKGKSIVEISFEINKSVPTINRMVKDLKIKYDNVQRENPDMFPERKMREK